MAGTTSRYGLALMSGGSDQPVPDEVADVKVINDGLKLIDGFLGIKECTSGTRPASPKVGQQIVETDTSLTYYWTGVIWKLLAAGVQVPYGQVVRVNSVMSSGGPFQICGAAAWGVQPLGSGMLWNDASALDGFKVPIAGRYQINAQLVIAATGGPAATAQGKLTVTKNGLTEAQNIAYNTVPMMASRDTIMQISRTFALAAGDIVRLGWYHTAGGVVSTWTGADGSWFEIQYVGP